MHSDIEYNLSTVEMKTWSGRRRDDAVRSDVYEVQLDRKMASDLNLYSTKAEKAASLLRAFGRIRDQYSLDFDDIAILLACGRINFGSRRHPISYAQAANVSSLADYVGIPRETVRRRLRILASKQLVARVAHGYIVSELAAWSSLTGES